MSMLKERAVFTFSAPVKAELEERIPKSKRSQFVEQAVARALMAEAKRQALAVLDESPNDTKGQDSVKLLRQIRQQRNQDIILRHTAFK